MALSAMAFLPGLPPTVVNPRGSAALIFMHGLGDTGRRDNCVFPAQRLASTLMFLRCLLPFQKSIHAGISLQTAQHKVHLSYGSTRRVTINGGASMPGAQQVSL